MKKKLLSLLLALVLCSTLVAPALAASYEIPDTYHPQYRYPAIEDFVTITSNRVEYAQTTTLGNLKSLSLESLDWPVELYRTTGATWLSISTPAAYRYIYIYYSPDWTQMRSDNKTTIEMDDMSSVTAVYAMEKTGVYVVEMRFATIPAKCVFTVEVTNDGTLPPVEKPVPVPDPPITPPVGEPVELPAPPERPNLFICIGQVINTFRIPVLTSRDESTVTVYPPSEDGGEGDDLQIPVYGNGDIHESTITVYQLPEGGCLLGAILRGNTYLNLRDDGCYSLKNGTFSENTGIDWSGPCATLHGPGPDEYELNRSRMQGHELTNIYGLRMGTSTIYYTFADLSAYEKAIPTTTDFTDVEADSYYAQPVAWAVDLGVTTGTSATTFSPNKTCTNAQILTFMWRACGSPSTSVDAPFTNLTGNEYYAQAARWAYVKGLIEGHEVFDANKPCTRAMTMEYFWRLNYRPDPSAPTSFADVSASAPYAEAVAWAVEAGITTGTSKTTFSPDATCTRGQIVTFLYRAMQ